MSKKDAKAAPDFFSSLPPGFLDNPLTQSMRASAQQIWAAGLGAFAKEGGGGKLFDQLVSEGMKLQHKTQEIAQKKLGGMADLGQEMGAKARKQWSQLEAVFEHRVEQALSSMGMPTATEVRELRAHLDALAAEVAALKAVQANKAPAPNSKAAPARKAAPRKAPATEAAAKGASVKKASAKKAAAKKPAA